MNTLSGIGRAQREVLWQKKMDQLTRVTDGLGLGLDEPIVDTVAALQLHGFPTRQSCGGHEDGGCAAPWVDIQSTNEPIPVFNNPAYCHYTTQYEGQEDAFRAVAAQHGLGLDEMMQRNGPMEMFQVRGEALALAAKNGETRDYKQFKAENLALHSKFESIVHTYNADHPAGPDQQIQFTVGFGNGSFRIATGDKVAGKILRECSPEEITHRQEHLPTNRLAMANFGAWLKEEYLTSGPLNP